MNDQEFIDQLSFNGYARRWDIFPFEGCVPCRVTGRYVESDESFAKRVKAIIKEQSDVKKQLPITKE